MATVLPKECTLICAIFTHMKNTISKTNFLKSIDDLPEDLSVDQLFDRILFLQKIEQGLIDSDQGNTLSTEELIANINKWIK